MRSAVGRGQFSNREARYSGIPSPLCCGFAIMVKCSERVMTFRGRKRTLTITRKHDPAKQGDAVGIAAPCPCVLHGQVIAI